MLDSPALGLLGLLAPAVLILAAVIVGGILREIFYTIPPRKEKKDDQGQGRRRTWLS
jgi:hypothetical protein